MALFQLNGDVKSKDKMLCDTFVYARAALQDSVVQDIEMNYMLADVDNQSWCFLFSKSQLLSQIN